MEIEKLYGKTINELLRLKEMYRKKHGLYIENNIGERGSFNGKTKEYFTCEFTMRVKHPTKKGRKWNRKMVFRTFDTYKEALVFSLEQADYALETMRDKKPTA